MGYEFGDFSFATTPYRLRRGEVEAELTPQQARLLELLLERAGEIVSRADIRARLWPTDVHVDFDRGINFCIARLRSALADPSSAPRYIETVPRRGYRLVAPVRRVTETPNPETARNARPVDSPPEPGSEPIMEPIVGSRRRSRLRVSRVSLTLFVLGALVSSLIGLDDADPSPMSPPFDTDGSCGHRLLSTALDEPADEALRRACWYERKQDLEMRQPTIEAYSTVLLHHPDLVPVLARLAMLYQHQGNFDRAEPLAERVLAMRPRADRNARVMATWVLAEIAFRQRFDWPRASRLYQKGLALADRHESLRLGYANLLSATGRHAEAIRLARETVTLHPLSLHARTELAEELYLGGAYRQAIEVARRVVETEPKRFYAHTLIMQAFRALGDDAAAFAAINRGLEPWGWEPGKVDSYASYSALRLERASYGDAHDQKQLLDVAINTYTIGEVESARRILERACIERSGWALPYYDVDPRFAPLRALPGLESLDRCLRGDFDLGTAVPGSYSPTVEDQAVVSPPSKLSAKMSGPKIGGRSVPWTMPRGW